MLFMGWGGSAVERGGVELVFGKARVLRHLPGGVLEAHPLLPQGQHLLHTFLQRHGGAGFLLAIVLFASIRERLVFADYPKCWDGFPIALVTAGLMALAFMGFSGLKIW